MSSTSSSCPFANVPQLTGFLNSLRNLAVCGDFPTQLHGNRKLFSVVNGETQHSSCLRAPIGAKRLIKRMQSTSMYTNEFIPTEVKGISITEECTPPAMLHYDISLITKTLLVTGVYDPVLIRKILMSNRQNDSALFKTPQSYERVGKVLDTADGIARQFFTARNDKYKNLRSHFNTTLTPTHLYERNDLAEQIRSCTSAVVDKCLKDGLVNDVTEVVFTIPCHVIQSLIFGKIIDGVKEDMWKLLPLISKNFSATATEADIALITSSEGYKHMQDIAQQIYDKPSDFPGILEQMALETNEDGKRAFDKNDIFAVMLFLFFAGEESLSSALTTTLYEIGKNKELQEKLQKIFATYYEEYEAMDLEILNEIPYLDWVVNEIFRLYPSLPVLVRNVNPKREHNDQPVIVENDDTHEKYEIQDDRVLFMNVWEAGRHPDYWVEPMKFIPERWDPEQKEKYHTERRNFLPFGAGPNKCLGETLAKLEVKALLYYFLEKMTWETVNDVPFDTRVTFKPLKPVAIQFKTG